MRRRVDWSRLSARGCVILKWIAIPVATELEYAQVAAWLQEHRPTIFDDDGVEFKLPDPVTANWISLRMRELRDELDERRA